MTMTQQSAAKRPKRSIGLWVTGILGSVALLASLSIAVSVGAVAVPLETVWGVLINKIAPDTVAQDWSNGREAIVWNIRFPRAILACLSALGWRWSGPACRL